MLTVEDALAQILERVTCLEAQESTVADAVGRTLGEDVFARRTVPPWDNSAMDGYAVRSEDLSKLPQRLTILETVPAGRTPSLAVGPNQCSKIMTGAPLPKGADAVVPVEQTQLLPDGVEIRASPRPGDFVRRQGEDARKGDLLLSKGTPLGIPEAALLWAQGMERAPFVRAPRVAILSTGDELKELSRIEEGYLVDTNGPALEACTKRLGAETVRLGIARDERSDVVRALQGFERFDVVLTSAGVSVGERDVVKDALDELGVQMAFWKVAIKPGKPLAFGQQGRTLFFGLPGNPASSLVSFELFVRPALLRMMGHPHVAPERVGACLTEPLRKAAGLTHYVRVRAEWRGKALWAGPLKSQSSGALRSVAQATHLLEFPSEATHLDEGETVTLLKLHWTAV